MSVPTPDWLTRHGADLRGNPDGRSWTVYFGDTLEYVLQIVPVKGQYSCRVKQTISGKSLESGSAHATPDDALRAGLEDLRQALGW
jgi:hypothetical protein